LLSEYVAKHARLRDFSTQLMLQTGTRLTDWLDHLVVPADESIFREAVSVGYEADPATDAWRHAGGMFPPLVTRQRPMHGDLQAGVAIKVESIDFFSHTHGLTTEATTSGSDGEPLRTALVAVAGDVGFWIVERHGFDGFNPPRVTNEELNAAQQHLGRCKKRPRRFERPADGFAHAQTLLREAHHDIGVDWATDLFFAAERIYWQSRNRAAQAQYDRQQRLGLGWANHDHHTYRSSRGCFSDLIATLELMGFECRERFYAGREAGWGAQVLEQHRCGLCVFADVDLSPDEVAQDFAHQPLAARNELGTVGLWCALHGEAFLEAGMHHLEAQFSFSVLTRPVSSSSKRESTR
jgi:hypothetical protein